MNSRAGRDIFLITAKRIFVFLTSDIWLTVRPQELQKAEVFASVFVLQTIRWEASSRTSEAPVLPPAPRPRSSCAQKWEPGTNYLSLLPHEFPPRMPGPGLGPSTDAIRAVSLQKCFQTPNPLHSFVLLAKGSPPKHSGVGPPPAAPAFHTALSKPVKGVPASGNLGHRTRPACSPRDPGS